ncbi:family 16 glycoside hydrolase [Prosthecobacter sp. SYSU 5D2]|uniref:family 16 glycoside hydrolase n=1 Tax=Prosthecobacter sp. SYSU 5D2 TaxID=3134134 RepID=UPI0031FF0D9E
MKIPSLLFLALASLVSAAEKPMLAIPGEVIYESKLDSAPASPWKIAKGQWELKDGVVRGAELEADKHGAVARLPNKLNDFIIEYEFKFEGARTTSLSINAVKDHMARINITPTSVTVQKDDNDHEGPDKAVVFARFPAELKPGTWNKVRLEMVGDLMLGQVNGLTAWGSDDLFKTDKMNPGFTVGGQSVDFRNLTIRNATLNPEWETAKATLPKPGEKVAPGAPKGKGKGKAKNKGAAAKKKRE